MAAPDDLLRYQHAARPGRATGCSPAECRAAEPLLAPGVRGGAELATTIRSTTGPGRGAALEACAGGGVSTDRTTRSPKSRVRVRTGDRRCPSPRARPLGQPASWCWPPGAVRRARGDPRDLRPPVRPVKGLTLRLLAPAPARRSSGGPSAAWSTVAVLPGAASRRHGRGRGHRRGEGVRPGRPGRRGRRPARRRPPAHPLVDEYDCSTRPPGCGPARPTTGPSWATTEVAGLLVATGHYRNGILLAPITAERVVELLPGADRSQRARCPLRCVLPRSIRPRRSVRRSPVSMPATLPRGRGDLSDQVNGTTLGRPRPAPPSTSWSTSGAPRPRASPSPSTARWSRGALGRTPRSRRRPDRDRHRRRRRLAVSTVGRGTGGTVGPWQPTPRRPLRTRLPPGFTVAGTDVGIAPPARHRRHVQPRLLAGGPRRLGDLARHGRRPTCRPHHPSLAGRPPAPASGSRCCPTPRDA